MLEVGAHFRFDRNKRGIGVLTASRTVASLLSARRRRLVRAAATEAKRKQKRTSHREDIAMELTRRHVFAGAAMVAAAPLLPSKPVAAAAGIQTRR